MTEQKTFAVRAEIALEDATLRAALRRFTDRAPLARRAGLDGLQNAEEIRDAARAIRARNLARIDDLWKQFAEQVEARNGSLFWAGEADEATTYAREVLQRRGAARVAKSKSMASEEIGLNEALEADGVEVVETDLGEFICQVAGEPPSHILAPAIHRDREGIGEILSRDAGRPLGDDPEALASYARDRLREIFLTADAGITGANFAVAETGTLVLVTNEGNGRMVTSVPPVHMAVVGLERIVATWEELDILLALLPRSATGQALTVYTTLVSGPRAAGETDGPEELHVIVLDNGRSGVLGSEYREILHCIRCGACLNVCPVYRQVGGHSYGSPYGGPIGAVLTPLLQQGRDDLAGASSLCAACHEACPVRIPIQDMLLRLRARDAERNPRRRERAAFRLWAALWSRPAGYRLTGRLLGRMGSRLGVTGRLGGPGKAWAAGRSLPEPASRSFLEARRRGRRS